MTKELTTEILEERLRGLKHCIDLRFEANEKALELARENMAGRLEAMNEFREQLNRQAGTFLTRQEVDAKIREVRVLLDSMEKRIQVGELLKAEVIGRFWTLGVVGALIILAIEFLIHYVFRVNM